MSETVDVILQIRDSTREPVKSSLEVEHLNVGVRARRAVLRLLICWVLAGVSVLVPLMHFVLVPGFFIAGFVLATLAFRGTVEVRSPKIACPKCAQVTPIEAGSTGWPVTIWCAACGTTFFARHGPAQAQKEEPSSVVSCTWRWR